MAATRSRSLVRGIMGTLSLLVLGLLPVHEAGAVSTNIDISQVYGGGGNSGAPYQND